MIKPHKTRNTLKNRIMAVIGDFATVVSGMTYSDADIEKYNSALEKAGSKIMVDIKKTMKGNLS